MTKKEYCQTHKPIAYYSGFHGLEIHGIEWGIEDYIYCVTGAWGPEAKRSYHKLKIHCDKKGDFYFMLHGYKCLLGDCMYF